MNEVNRRSFFSHPHLTLPIEHLTHKNALSACDRTRQEKLRVRWVCVFFTRKALHCSACNRTAFRLLRFHCGHTAKAAKGFACVPQQSGHGCEKLLRLTTGWFRYGFAYSTQVAGLTDSPVMRYSIPCVATHGYHADQKRNAHP